MGSKPVCEVMKGLSAMTEPEEPKKVSFFMSTVSFIVLLTRLGVRDNVMTDEMFSRFVKKYKHWKV